MVDMMAIHVGSRQSNATSKRCISSGSIQPRLNLKVPLHVDPPPKDGMLANPKVTDGAKSLERMSKGPQTPVRLLSPMSMPSKHPLPTHIIKTRSLRLPLRIKISAQSKQVHRRIFQS